MTKTNPKLNEPMVAPKTHEQTKAELKLKRYNAEPCIISCIIGPDNDETTVYAKVENSRGRCQLTANRERAEIRTRIESTRICDSMKKIADENKSTTTMRDFQVIALKQTKSSEGAK